MATKKKQQDKSGLAGAQLSALRRKHSKIRLEGETAGLSPAQVAGKLSAATRAAKTKAGL